MSANTNAALAGAEPMSLAHLTDAELLTQTRSLVGRSNRLLAELLAHLGEVEARGIHRTRACSSLYTYCIYELRFSEDEAFRRVSAARLVRRFPALLDAIASGELHLTGLLMLGPHLTAENLVEVMARAKHRTKRELARLVRVLDPLPPVPTRIEPLGPVPALMVPPEPSWEQFVGAMNPVRELEVGERPREWGLEGETAPRDPSVAAYPPTELNALDLPAPARANAERAGELTAPQRYAVQFTATEEYVRLVDEAKALLSHSAPRASLEEVQLRAMRAFVESLRKRKYSDKAPAAEPPSDPPPRHTDESDARASIDAESPPTATNASAAPNNAAATPSNPRQRGGSTTSETAAPSAARDPRGRGRHIPAAIRRAVAARDGHSCTYVDASGSRCPETQRLEFHHNVPFAVSPAHDVANITSRCAAHNALAAEEDFGRDFVHAQRSAARHEPISRQRPCAPCRSPDV